MAAAAPDEQCEQARRLRAAGWSIRRIARKLGQCVGWVHKHTSAVPIVKGTSQPVEDPVEEERKRIARQAREDQVRAAVKEQAFRDYLRELVSANVPPMPVQPQPPATRVPKGAHVRSPLLCLTDWHFEERVSEAGVMGLNRYDIPIACRRVWRIVDTCKAWKRDVEAGGRFSVGEITVALMGDFLTGTLHGLEKHSDAPNVVRASLACGDLVALALRDLASVFPKVTVVGVVGNHGRLPDAKKVPTKDPTRSWDYLAYSVAQRRLEEVRNITWHLPESYGVLFEVGGHLCYVCHGNFIPNNLGVVGYGVRRFTSSLASNLQAAGKPLRYAFFGHWHAANSSEFAGVEAFICPSLIGTQEYGFLSGGGVSRSAQQLFIFDRNLGLVGMERLYGDGVGTAGTYTVAV